MAGTKEGGKKAAQTNKRKHGAEFYRNIGKLGGARGITGGFASERVGPDGMTGRERAVVAGAKGGRISKRGRSRVTAY